MYYLYLEEKYIEVRVLPSETYKIECLLKKGFRRVGSPVNGVLLFRKRKEE